MPNRPGGLGWLFVAFVATLLSFSASAAYSQVRIAEVDRLARGISENAAPSIEHLTTARGELQAMRAELDDYVASAFGKSERKITWEDVRHARADIDANIGVYLGLPVFSGERQLWDDVRTNLVHFDDAVHRVNEAVRLGDEVGAKRLLEEDVRIAVDASARAIQASIELNARNAHDLATHIARVRSRVMWYTVLLYGVSAILSTVLVLAATRAMRRYTTLAELHYNLLTRRADELEQFAGRVAHDILSPLMTVALGLRLADVPEPERRGAQLQRAERSLGRVKRIVDGLLEFARAGAAPEPNARARVGEAMDDVASELSDAATDANIELALDTTCVATVACSPGVLTSALMNLVRNAIKYMNDAAIRRIDVRAVDLGTLVRFEVADTGPGLPPGTEERVFEPYVRIANAAQPGIGLGLATVKRMAEAHGGTSGVKSTPGVGCLFWFELPKAVGETILED